MNKEKLIHRKGKNIMRKTVFHSTICYTVMHKYIHLCSISWKIFNAEFDTSRMGDRQ